MRKSILFTILAALVVAISVGVYYSSTKLPFEIDPAQEKVDLATSRQLIDGDDAAGALEIIKKYNTRISIKTPEGQEWLDLLIDASVNERNPSQLVVLYDYYPTAFDNKEQAAQFVGQAFLVNKQAASYEKLRGKWEGKEKDTSVWVSLDADRLLLDGKRNEAITLLESANFEGKDDVGRLLRLAVLSVDNSPQKAWNYLTEALKKDPNNPVIYLYRARLLEAAGKLPLSLTEYIAAYQSSPESLGLLDQIGSFFVRYGRYEQALELWSAHLTPPSNGYFWTKAWFWGHVVTPAKVDWKELTPPEDKMKPYVEYLVHLPENQYWSADEFEEIPQNSQFLITQQSTFWLRLMQNLKDGQEEKALELVQYNPFKRNSWSPDLERGIQRILTYRARGTLVIADAAIAPPKNPNIDQKSNKKLPAWKTRFFEELDYIADSGKEIPAKLANFLKSDEIFSAAMVAAGWREAAIQLGKEQVLSSDFPAWFSYGYTQALRFNRDVDAALTFVQKQNQTSSIELLTAEHMVASGNRKDGIKKLEKLAEDPPPIGNRAAFLLAYAYANNKQYDKAKATIMNNSDLATATAGKETLAKIALLQGDDAKATEIYNAIKEESDEAKSYLARVAYKQKSWSEAKVMTEELLKKYPNNAMLRKNYSKIVEHNGNNG